ncbi:Cas4p protein [Uncinocarpus reesii 1704]|uniref:Cas4p protein n=1 Tax=Uncinocarpus reesii (strain UAMH 1704) TaxID=336963 RepID=C4JYK3_UNCRE|nr:Cas4p protein [Uncinocarpus reesii 1704]EEP82389.1 Cas4p protein [Uncinocarpus reesii 1704]
MSAAEQEKSRSSGEDKPAASSPSSSSPSTADAPVLPTVNPAVPKTEPPKSTLHPAFYVVSWIFFSSSVILYNKYLLDEKESIFPIILTTWHLAFAAFMTQVLARTTTLLDGRKKVKMTGRVYLRAIVPIGFFFSLSLICGNVAYLYLSVAFIQMLKATTPVAVLICTWSLGMAPPNMRVLFNVSFIVLGVIIASFGEIHFVLIGFLFQIGGIAFEATRLVMVQRLLSSAEYKMDPLVSLYYFAPVCAVMNFVVALFVEIPRCGLADIQKAGLITLLANGMVAFLLNVAVVFLIGKTSSLVLTLCGVLKDILLVTISAMWWKTPVTPLQLFGYTIAIGGLLYYKLGADKMKEYASQANRSWAEYGATNPIRRRLIVVGVSAFVIICLLVQVGGPYDPNSLKGMIPGKTTANNA